MRISQKCVLLSALSILLTSFTACQGKNNNIIDQSETNLSIGETDTIQIGNSTENDSISDVLSNKDFNSYIKSIYNDDNYVNQLYNYYAGVESGNTSDLDGDGVSDEIEFQLGLDPKLSDTDNDGIDDLTELLLGLNPLVNDVKLDLDSDGLSNIEEIRYGTNLNKSDSDDDGLSDYDEIFLYKTDPLLIDTDNDGISDFDEIKINLNPLVAMSDGSTLDSQRIFYQTIDASVTSQVSLYDYSLSATVDAGGYADNAITIQSSVGFANLKDSFTSIKGEVLDVQYNPNFAFADVTLTFTINDNLLLEPPIDNDLYIQGVTSYQNFIRTYSDVYLTSTLDGVKRYVVFEYDTQTSTLLPMNCTYDEQANTITVRSENSSGTYCLIDLYDWLHNYCNMFDENALTTTDTSITTPDTSITTNTTDETSTDTGDTDTTDESTIESFTNTDVTNYYTSIDAEEF